MGRPLPSDLPFRRASAQPSAGVAALVQPPPRPPRRGGSHGSATRPPTPLHVRRATPSPRSPAEGDAPDPTSPGSCAFPRARASPALAGPCGGSPRSASAGSCLPSPRLLGLLPLSPAPPARPELGSASCPTRGRRRLLSEASEAPILCAERTPPAWPGIPAHPPRRRAPRAREPGALLGAWDPAEPLPSPRGSAEMQAAL